MNNQAVYNIAEICARHGLTDVVLSPGSRSAPLTLAFARHPAFAGKVKVIPDERAAAFVALGIAQATRRPVVLVCTSGSAGLNYAPAVAEAFFQQVPLLIFTADRPPEWIDQLDGQTIRQQNLYGRHAKGSFDFPVNTTHADEKWFSERIINEAINLAQAGPAGPVQVNVPLREPFYPKAGEEITFEQDVKIIRDDAGIPANTFWMDSLTSQSYRDLLKRVLVVIGQQPPDPDLLDALKHFAHQSGATVIADTISNVAANVPAILSQDIFLSNTEEAFRESLRPDLLITIGKSLISKSLKLHLRNYPARQHWHIQPDNNPVADVFRSLTRVFRAAPALFLRNFAAEFSQESRIGALTYGKIWRTANRRAIEFEKAFFTDAFNSFNEFIAFRFILAALPESTALHVANSMAVRYANVLGIPQDRKIEVFANRGTSGIDGCTSTAVGYALAEPTKPVVLLTGDVAFFYDRNAFWHNYPLPNLRVVLFNNHGGGIFRIIDGPRQQPELDEYFETRQALTAENTCRDFGMRYFPVTDFAELDATLPTFFAAATGAAVLEIFTDTRTNAAFFEEYRAAVRTYFAG